MFGFTEIEVRRGIVRVPAMAKTSGKSVRQRVHIQRDERGQIFVGRRRQIERRRDRPVRLLVSNEKQTKSGNDRDERIVCCTSRSPNSYWRRVLRFIIVDANKTPRK